MVRVRQILDFAPRAIGHIRCSTGNPTKSLKGAKYEKVISPRDCTNLSWLAVAQAQVWVDPYTRRDGTQGAPNRYVER
jgi:hypothetical protein